MTQETQTMSTPDIEKGVEDSAISAKSPQRQHSSFLLSSHRQRPDSSFPNLFYCPLSKQLMKDPVAVGPEGISYERSAAMQHFSDKKDLLLIPNRALQQLIQDATSNDLRSKFQKSASSWRKSMHSTIQLSSSSPLHDAYYCPITFSLLHHPVLDPEGNTFELKAIQAWMDKNGNSPITRTPLTLEDLVPNVAIRELLQEELKRDPNRESLRQYQQEEETMQDDKKAYPTTMEELEALRAEEEECSWLECLVLPFILLIYLVCMTIYFLLVILFYLFIFIWSLVSCCDDMTLED